GAAALTTTRSTARRWMSRSSTSSVTSTSWPRLPAIAASRDDVTPNGCHGSPYGPPPDRISVLAMPACTRRGPAPRCSRPLPDRLDHDIHPAIVRGTDRVPLPDELHAAGDVAPRARAAAPQLHGPGLDRADQVASGECEARGGHGEMDVGGLARLQMDAGIAEQLRHRPRDRGHGVMAVELDDVGA